MRYFILLICLLLTPIVHASVFHVNQPHPRGPLTIRTQNPLYLQFVAQPMEAATTLSKNKFAFDLSTTFTNFFDRSIKNNGAGVDLDMELWRTAFQINYGLTHRLTLGLELPFLSTSGGFLDSFVQDYHNAFGFPNAGRNDVDNGRFSSKVTRNGNTVYDANETDLGFGDIPLNFKLNFFDETKKLPALALKTTLKMPTGRASNGTGSGRVDFAASLLSQKSLGRFHLYSQLGFAAFGGHSDKELNALTKKGALLYGQAFEFNLTKHHSFITQISGSSRFFKDTTISELSEMAMDLSFGLTGEFPCKKEDRAFSYHIAFSEDPVANGPSADFSVLMGVGVKY